MANESSPPARWPQRVIIEYVDGKNRIYSFGLLAENGDVQADEEETFGSLPGGECDVVTADGTRLSRADYCAKLGLSA